MSWVWNGVDISDGIVNREKKENSTVNYNGFEMVRREDAW